MLVAVPPVLSVPYAQAESTLKAKGFRVARTDVDSNEPVETVLRQDPGGNQMVPQGSTVTLTVSKGPTRKQVPPVTTLDKDTAVSTLKDSGFKVKIVPQDTNDPTQENIVLDQSPAAGSLADPNSVVTIFVGHLVGATDTTATVP